MTDQMPANVYQKCTINKTRKSEQPWMKTKKKKKKTKKNNNSNGICIRTNTNMHNEGTPENSCFHRTLINVPYMHNEETPKEQLANEGII